VLNIAINKLYKTPIG